MSELKIEVGKFYRTGFGDKARIYATDGVEHYPIHGAVLLGRGWRSVVWMADGRRLGDSPSPADIVAEWDEED